jgi:hypothetical protein
MTVFVYVNTSKQVSDADHINVFANLYTGPEGGRSNTGSGANRIGRCTIVRMVLLFGARGCLEFAATEPARALALLFEGADARRAGIGGDHAPFLPSMVTKTSQCAVPPS